MRHNLIYAVFLVSLLGVVLVLPWVMEARDRQITVGSLEKAYATRVAALDADIASTTKAMDALQAACKETRNNPRCYGYVNPDWAALSQKKNELEFERRSITPAYNLLNEALK